LYIETFSLQLNKPKVRLSLVPISFLDIFALDTDPSIGNLSTDVVEPRTAIGSLTFSFWPMVALPYRFHNGKPLDTKTRIFTALEEEQKQTDKQQKQLPVDVRGFQMAVLKFPNVFEASL